MIEFACPNCNKAMRVDDKYMGRQGKCSKCGSTVEVPDRSTLIEFMCGGCGHWIRVGEHYAGKQGKCPKCKQPVAVPLQESASDAGASESESDEEATQSGRGLAIVLSSVVTVVVVAIIGLLIWFKPWISEPDMGPIVPSTPQEPVTTGPASQASTQDEVILVPIVPSVPQETASAAPKPPMPKQAEPAPKPVVTPQVSQTKPLQFNPSPGDKRRLRVTMTTQYSMSSPEGGPTQDITGIQSVTVDIEADEVQADGTFPVGVTLGQIQIKTVTQGRTQVQYDSTQASTEDDPAQDIYAPFIGKRFTIRVSRFGEIIDSGMDALFLAAAQARVEAEDEAMRKRLQEKADRVIERTDQGFGSRQARIQVVKRQLEAFPMLGRGEIRSLLGHLLPFLPNQAVQAGTNWSGPLAIRAGTHVEMPVTYTVTSVDEDNCTIEARGERGVDEEPFVYQAGQATVTAQLAGSSQVKLRVNRHTGWLGHKEQKTSLSGQIIQASADAQGAATSIKTRMDITTTVESVE